MARGQRCLALTAQGAAVLEGLVPGIERLQQGLLGKLRPEEQADFMRLLAKFVGADGERPAQPGA